MNTVAERLEARSIPEPNSGCVLWLGTVSSVNGYGYISIGGRNWLAHRVAYELAHGAIPPRLTVDHLCRVRCCINPAHLQAVTNAENVRRGASAKLTVAAVRSVREMYAAGNTHHEVAAAIGISPSHARNIVTGKRWVAP